MTATDFIADSLWILVAIGLYAGFVAFVLLCFDAIRESDADTRASRQRAPAETSAFDHHIAA